MARARRHLTAAIAVAFAAIVKSSATAIVRYFDNGSSIKAILKQYENDEVIRPTRSVYIEENYVDVTTPCWASVDPAIPTR
uniref:Uncharacterized protein n=1 Tax=Vespula pensylvanica TaxID=30213 RepID=A0A834UES1_VESPE|nr:hypothetical protein H0235_003244 [Vespula pensylvanica]